MAFSYTSNFPIQGFCGISYGINHYVPWHAFQDSSDLKGLKLGIHNIYGTKYLYLYRFNLNYDDDLEVKKPYEQRRIDLQERSRTLIKNSKNKIYDQLAPILKSYPRGKIPSFNPSSTRITKDLFNDLRIRVSNEITRELKEGVFKYRKKIIHPKNLNYTKKQITEEVKNFNFEEGMYEEIMKFEEMVSVFITFFLQHTLYDVTELMVEVHQINPFFALKWFNKAKVKILKKYSKKEQDIFELEKIFYELTDGVLIFEKDEHIIDHFKGTIHFPKAFFEFPGHVYITNYRIIVPNIPKVMFIGGGNGGGYWGGNQGISGAVTRVIAGLIESGVKKHIMKARNEFLQVLSQNPKMFFFNKPYNIIKPQIGNLKFIMNYDFNDKRTSQTKVYKLGFGVEVKKYKKEANTEFIRRKDEIFSKIREIFAKISETICPKCYNMQDKSLDKCENCGEVLKFRM